MLTYAPFHNSWDESWMRQDVGQRLGLACSTEYLNHLDFPLVCCWVFFFWMPAPAFLCLLRLCILPLLINQRNTALGPSFRQKMSKRMAKDNSVVIFKALVYFYHYFFCIFVHSLRHFFCVCEITQLSALDYMFIVFQVLKSLEQRLKPYLYSSCAL